MELCFDILVNNKAVYGIRHKPCEATQKNIAVVLLHGWAGYRTGPHDMLVKTARRLTAKGYDCFRFDFRGKGYSQGDRRQTNNKTMLEDLDGILRYVRHELDQPQIILAGICSGAKLALYYARSGDLPISHVIELSSPVLRQNEVESTLAAIHAKNTLTEYAKRLLRSGTWQKLVSGELHIKAVWRNINRPLKQFLLKRDKKPAKITPATNKEQKAPFEKFQGQMLLIHGEKDPETKPALEQIHEMLRRYQLPADTSIIKDANHSFYSLHWEREIIQLMEDWLEQRGS